MGRTLRAGMGVVAAGIAVGLAAVPAEGRIDAEVQVIDSNAGAAVVGLTSRVPAESAGGFVFSATAITLDKAVAKAAVFTSGDLAEGFLSSSSEQYRNPTLIAAQYPPTSTVPAESRGGSDAGVATLRAAATDQPSATAEAEGAQAGDATTLAVRHGSSMSRSELGHDGVVTRAVAVASGISIGGVVTVTSATTEAVTTVPPRGRPTTELKVTFTGLLVGGVPAELTDQGLRISDRIPVGPRELAAFNAATAQLAERGIVVTAAPAVQETGAEDARVEGGAIVVRYKVADQMGGDEEIVIARAQSRSTLLMAEAPPSSPPVPELPEPLVPPAEFGLVPVPAHAGEGFSLSGPAAATSGGSSRAGTPDGGLAARPRLADVEPDRRGPNGSVAVSDSAVADIASAAGGPLNLVDSSLDTAVTRLRTGYRFILLLAAAGAAAYLAIDRTRSR